MLYAMLGLPIYALYLNYANNAFTRFISGLSRLVLWCFRDRRRNENEVSAQKVMNKTGMNRTDKTSNVATSMGKHAMQNGNKYKRLSSEDDHEKSPSAAQRVKKALKRPVLDTENTTETLLSDSSSNSIETERSPQASPRAATPTENTDHRNNSVIVKASTSLFLKLFLSFLLLVLYIVMLLIWCPVMENETMFDEIYWLMIRFTTIGFGDEFRDITRNPDHLPGSLNSFIVSLVILPLGISIASHIFYVYRKLGANRLRRAKKSSCRGIRIRFECECVPKN